MIVYIYLALHVCLTMALRPQIIKKTTSTEFDKTTIAFYNAENLFDTFNDSLTYDEDYTPDGKNQFTIEQYKKKIHNTAKVISEIGSKKNKTGPAIIGLAEIENYTVLKDLIDSDQLSRAQYQIIHQDSPDRRGIDVALLYRESEFLPLEVEFREVKLWNELGERIYTRDILLVKGILENEELYLIVNHWPSRRGGKQRSEPKRAKTAYLVHQMISRILLENHNSKILILGDFNDNPTDKSIKKELLKPIKILNDEYYTFYNPMEFMFKKGWNSLSYRDELHLFDQIILSSNLKLKGDFINVFQFYRAGIYNPSYLTSHKGPYKGYPKRSFQNNRFADGYSDHYPVYVQLIKVR